MKTFHFYSLATGVILPGFSYTGDGEHAALNAPAGHVAVSGVLDALSQRVDLETGELVDYQPPAPADDADRTWAWDATSRRWVDTLTVAGRKPAMLSRLENGMRAAELAAQGRCQREVLLALLAAQTPPGAAVTRLGELEAQITALRSKHAAVLAATTHPQLDAIDL